MFGLPIVPFAHYTKEVPDENFGEMDDPAAHFAQQRLQEIEEEEENEPEEAHCNARNNIGGFDLLF